VGPPGWLRFVERPFPSANMVVIAGSKPVLVDSGYGSDLTRTEGLLGEQGLDPADRSTYLRPLLRIHDSSLPSPTLPMKASIALRERRRPEPPQIV
jgi:hypothetical protein